MNENFIDLLGKPYQRGGRGPNSFDCWGIIVEGGRRFGHTYPDWSTADWAEKDHAARFNDERKDWIFIHRNALQPGDVGITDQPTGGKHACLYIGHGYVIHSTSGMGVLIEEVDKYISIHGSTKWARKQ